MMDFQQFIETLPAEMPDPERETIVEIFRKFSLSYHLANHPQSIPPICVVRAGLDAPIINATINKFVDLAKCEGVKVSFFQHPEGHHAFDVLDNDEKSQLIIKRTLEFIQEQTTNQ